MEVFHSSGECAVSQMVWKSVIRVLVEREERYLYASAGIVSGPEDLLFFVLAMAFLISSPVILAQVSLFSRFLWLMGRWASFVALLFVFLYSRSVFVERSFSIEGVMLYAAMYLVDASSLYSSMAVYASMMCERIEVGVVCVMLGLFGSFIVFGILWEGGCV